MATTLRRVGPMGPAMTSARRIEPIGTERFCITGQREYAAEAKLGIAVAAEDARDHAPDGWPDRVGPCLHPRRWPLAVVAVGLGFVLFARRVLAPRAEAAFMRGDALAAVKDLHRASRRT